MEIDGVDEFITIGWAWVRRVGASVARTVGLRTAVPTSEYLSFSIQLSTIISDEVYYSEFKNKLSIYGNAPI